MASSLPITGKAHLLVIVECVLLGIDFVVVGLRLWARQIKQKPLALNDYMILLALMFTSGLVVSEIIGVFVAGGGNHVWEILASPGQGPPALILDAKVGLIVDTLWNLSTICLKVSVLHLYIQVFPNTHFRRCTYGVMTLCLICSASFFLLGFLLCHPLAYFWDRSIEGYCGNQLLAYMIPGIINMVLDFIILALPIPLLWALQAPLGKRLAIVTVFSMGLIICIMCGVRLKFVLELDSNDFTNTITDFALWAALEPLLSIVSVSLPILPPVFSKIFKSNFVLRTVRSTIRHTTDKDPKDQRWALSTFQRSRLDGKQQFNRLDTESELITVDEVHPSVSHKTQAFWARSEDPEEVDSSPEGQIRVTRGWAVRSN